ncbi:lysine--tRNA ligase [bacterium]|nr:lysine--tRNA ligase [bacterium]
MEKKKSMHWADQTAEKIIAEWGDKDSYTCASGITPSGTVHVGNFREMISVDLVVRALRSRGKKVRFIYSWDDYDVFRKVPLNMPQPELLEKYLRFPITMVPDPWGRDASYARHHEVDVESVLPTVGIHPEFLYQADRYRAGRYAEGMRRALEMREHLKTILDKYRDEDHKIQCGHKETGDLRKLAGAKLVWRVDWPMRWNQEKVEFEPAGKDHHSQGGSFDTSKHVVEEVYGRKPPVTFRYDFIGIKGSPGKMSSSKGKVVDLPDLLKVYQPELVRYLFAGTRPNTEFVISFDLDVIKIYEDYDKTERIYWGAEKAKSEDAEAMERRIYELSQVDGMPAEAPYQVPFRHLCNLLLIHQGDVEAVLASLPGIKESQKAGVRARATCAWHWVNECAPEDFRFAVKKPGEKVELDEVGLACVRRLRDDVVAKLESFADEKAVAEAIYAAAAAAGTDGKTLFKAAYNALVGKDQGPRLAGFLGTLGKDKVLAILAAY